MLHRLTRQIGFGWAVRIIACAYPPALAYGIDILTSLSSHRPLCGSNICCHHAQQITFRQNAEALRFVVLPQPTYTMVYRGSLFHHDGPCKSHGCTVMKGLADSRIVHSNILYRNIRRCSGNYRRKSSILSITYIDGLQRRWTNNTGTP